MIEPASSCTNPSWGEARRQPAALPSAQRRPAMSDQRSRYATVTRSVGANVASRAAVGSHLFDDACGGNDRRQEVWLVADELFDGCTMERLAAVGHRGEREDHRRIGIVGEEPSQLLQRALRQGRRNGRHEQRIGGAEHTLAREGDAGGHSPRWRCRNGRREVRAVRRGGASVASCRRGRGRGAAGRSRRARCGERVRRWQGCWPKPFACRPRAPWCRPTRRVLPARGRWRRPAGRGPRAAHGPRPAPPRGQG